MRFRAWPRARPESAAPAPSRRSNCARQNRRGEVQGPPPAGAVLRPGLHAGCRSAPRPAGRPEVPQDADDAVRPGGRDDVLHRPEGAAGLHRRSRRAGQNHQRTGHRRSGHGQRQHRRGQRGRHRRRLHAGRQRVQHLQHRPQTGRAGDGGEDAGQLAGEEGADLLRQRHEPHRRRQPGAVARHRERRHPQQRRVLSHRRARPGGHGAGGRCDARFAGRPGHVLRQFAARRPRQLPGAAGDPLHAGGGHRRQGAARQQRSRPGHRAGAEGHLQLLHPRLLQHQRRARRAVPPHQSADREEAEREARLPQRLLRLQGVQAVQLLGPRTPACRKR